MTETKTAARKSTEPMPEVGSISHEVLAKRLANYLRHFPPPDPPDRWEELSASRKQYFRNAVYSMLNPARWVP
jgi:hypothetical protein